jgi:hypothetical protein
MVDAAFKSTVILLVYVEFCKKPDAISAHRFQVLHVLEQSRTHNGR